jgi:hypothetical protein
MNDRLLPEEVEDMEEVRVVLEPGTCPTSLRSPEPISVVSAHPGNGQG